MSGDEYDEDEVLWQTPPPKRAALGRAGARSGAARVIDFMDTPDTIVVPDEVEVSGGGSDDAGSSSQAGAAPAQRAGPRRGGRGAAGGGTGAPLSKPANEWFRKRGTDLRR